MKVMIGARGLSSSAFSMTGGGGATTTCSTLCTPALFFENESVALGDLRRDIGLDRLIDVRKNIECHQLGDELMRFQTKLSRKLLHNDRRLDVNDFLCRRLGFGWSRFNHS